MIRVAFNHAVPASITLVIVCALATDCGMRKDGTIMHGIPQEVVQYLSSDDSLARASLSELYPELYQTLDGPATRRELLSWLDGDEAWKPISQTLTENTLAFLGQSAVPEEVDVVRPFLLHGDPHIRLRASEFLLGLYFPNRNDDAMFLLLQNMLMDEHDLVRTQGARFVERANAVRKFNKFLRRWITVAPSRGWQDSESFEVIEGLLKE